MTNTYKPYSQEVKNWNFIFGNSPEKGNPTGTLRKMLRQIPFVVEEAQEMQDAADTGPDIVEVLDALHDLRFVSDQIAVYLESLGVDLEGSWKEVCRSNNSKYSYDEEALKDDLTKYEPGFAAVHHEEDLEGNRVYVLKRSSDFKIMKPSCFSEPDLLPFIPVEYQN